MHKQPPNAGTLKQLAILALQQQRYADAISHAATAYDRTPLDSELLLIQSIAYSQIGNLSKAAQLIRRTLKLAPTNATAHLIHGNILNNQGNITGAINAYQDAITHKPNFIEALNNLGSILRISGRLQEAEHHLKNALKVMPQNPVVMTNLGLVEKDKGNHLQAIEIYKNTLKSHPEHADAHFNLANVLQIQGVSKDAETHYRRAIEFNPSHVMALHGLGQLLSSEGKYDEALQILKYAKTLRPDLHDISAAIADIYEKQGDDEMAAIILEPLLASPKVSPGAAISFAKLAPRLNRQVEAINLLKIQSTNPALPSQIKTDIYFSLGKLLDSTGDYEKAFKYFRLGNSGRATTTVTGNSLTQLEAIKQVFNPENQEHAPRSDNYSSSPVFIVGMPRSGTTLVEQIVSSHPSISGGGELPYIGELLNSFPERFGSSSTYPACINDLSKDDLNSLAQEYLDKLHIHASEAGRITDKMPHNFLHLGLIDRLFPAARIIHCIRNPIDTCLSIYFHNFSGNHPYMSDLRELGKYYKGYIELMDHWKSVIQVPMMEVVYEDLVANQETVSREIISFCGVDWNQQCLHFEETDRIVNTPSYRQVRQPIYTKSVSRWRNYERYLEPLRSALE